MRGFKFIDLFAGIGGFRLAMQSQGGNCVFSSEWDSQAQITYKANFEKYQKGTSLKLKNRTFLNMIFSAAVSHAKHLAYPENKWDLKT